MDLKVGFWSWYFLGVDNYFIIGGRCCNDFGILYGVIVKFFFLVVKLVGILMKENVSVGGFREVLE